MKRRSLLRWMLAGLGSAGVLHGFPGLGWAQPGAPPVQPRIERPEAQPLRIPQLSPELEKVLQDWASASAKVQSLQGKHYRFVYDQVFFVEKRSSGVFYYESPDKGRIDIEGASIKPGAVGQRVGPGGKPYKLESDMPQRWICDGKAITQVNESEKSFEMYPIPPEKQGQKIMDGPLPFLFGMPPAQAKLRFDLKLLQQTETQIMLAAQPKWQQDAANYREAKIILDPATYLPMAVQLIDPSGNSETVFRFYELEVNKGRRGGFQLPFLAEKDPFQPNLRAYKMVTRPVEQKTVDDLKNRPGQSSQREPNSGTIKAARFPNGGGQ